MAKENSGHKNLKPIKPGEVRNPKGKTPGTLNNTTILRNILLAGMTPDEKKKAGKHFDPRAFLFEKLRVATESDKQSEVIMAVKEMFDRTEGKSIARVEQTVNDVTPPNKIRLVAPKVDD